MHIHTQNIEALKQIRRNILTGVGMSLFGLVVTFTDVRSKAADIAIGNLLVSSMYHIVIIATGDEFYRKRTFPEVSIFTRLSGCYCFSVDRKSS